MDRSSSLPKYTRMTTDEDEGEQHDTRRIGLFRLAVAGAGVLVLGFAFLLALLLSLSVLTAWLLPKIGVYPLPDSAQTTSIQAPSGAPLGYKKGTGTPCGETWQEAEAAGCAFDLMTMSWLPEECFDSELNAEFLEEGPWPFYTSDTTKVEAPPEERTRLPSIEAIGKSTELMWTDRRYHFYHCIFGWKQMHRAIERGWKIETSLGTYHHTEHCTDTLTNITIPFDAVVTRVEVSFPAC